MVNSPLSELKCLQWKPGGTGAKHTKFLVGFIESASRRVFLDLPSFVLEMNTVCHRANSGLASRCT